MPCYIYLVFYIFYPDVLFFYCNQYTKMSVLESSNQHVMTTAKEVLNEEVPGYLAPLVDKMVENDIDADTIQSVVRGTPQLATPMLGPVPGGVIISYVPVLPLIVAYITVLVLLIIILFNLGSGDWWYIGKLFLAGVLTIGTAYAVREVLTWVPAIGDRYNARRIPAQMAQQTRGWLATLPVIGPVSRFILAPYNALMWVATL